jgi:tripartite-type tricarboxylate transporter receptor subunit TctC
MNGARLLLCAAGALAVGGATGALAQGAPGAYPVRPIRLIEPFPPGGGSNMVARLISQKLTEALGYAVVVDSRPGAGGSMGTDLAAKAQPDGYTLVVGTASTMVINPNMMKVAYHPVRDFAPVALATTIPLIIVVHPSVAAKSLRELTAVARARPAQLNFGSSGPGTISHLAGELFKVVTKCDHVHVPYKGGGPALIELLGGQVQVTFNNMLSALPHVRADKLRALAVTGAQRSSAAPEVPTALESGVPGYVVLQWNGFFAPIGTPRAVIARLNAEIDRALAEKEMRERLAGEGAEVGGGTPERLGAFVAAEYAKWGKVIRVAGIRGQD